MKRLVSVTVAIGLMAAIWAVFSAYGLPAVDDLHRCGWDRVACTRGMLRIIGFFFGMAGTVGLAVVTDLDRRRG